jgi:hypothetical protein
VENPLLGKAASGETSSTSWVDHGLTLPLNLYEFSFVFLSFCKFMGGETTSTSQAQEQEDSHCLLEH